MNVIETRVKNEESTVLVDSFWYPFLLSTVVSSISWTKEMEMINVAGPPTLRPSSTSYVFSAVLFTVHSTPPCCLVRSDFTDIRITQRIERLFFFTHCIHRSECSLLVLRIRLYTDAVQYKSYFLISCNIRINQSLSEWQRQ